MGGENTVMARILVANYGREDLLALGSPLATISRAWGREVVEAEDHLDVLRQVTDAPPEAVLLYDTLPALSLITALLQRWL